MSMFCQWVGINAFILCWSVESSPVGKSPSGNKQRRMSAIPAMVHVHPPGSQETVTIKGPSAGTGIRLTNPGPQAPSEPQQGGMHFNNTSSKSSASAGDFFASRHAARAATSTPAAPPMQCVGSTTQPSQTSQPQQTKKCMGARLSGDAHVAPVQVNPPTGAGLRVDPAAYECRGSGGGIVSNPLNNTNSSQAPAWSRSGRREHSRSRSPLAAPMAGPPENAKDYELLINPGRTNPAASLENVDLQGASGFGGSGGVSGYDDMSGSDGGSVSGSESDGESVSESGSGSDDDDTGSGGQQGHAHEDIPQWMVRPSKAANAPQPFPPTSSTGPLPQSRPTQQPRFQLPGRGPATAPAACGARTGPGVTQSSANPMQDFRQKEINRRARVLMRLDRYKVQYDADAPTSNLELLDVKVRQERRCEAVVASLKTAIIGIAAFEEKLAQRYGYVDLESHQERIAMRLESYNETLQDVYDYYFSETDVGPLWALAMMHINDIATSHTENTIRKKLMEKAGITTQQQLQELATQLMSAQQQAMGGGSGSVHPQHARIPQTEPQQQPQQPSGAAVDAVNPHSRPMGCVSLPRPSFRPYGSAPSMDDVVQLLHETEDNLQRKKGDTPKGGVSAASSKDEDVRAALQSMSGRGSRTSK